MHTQALLVASLLTLTRAWVSFPGAQPLHQHPWDDPTPKNLEVPSPTPTLGPSEDSLRQLDATPSAPSISTIPSMTTVPYPTSSPSSPSESSLPLHAQLMRWIKRQGAAVSNPQAAQPNQVTQVSPVTTLTMMSKGEDISVVYTQTFPEVPEQWPSASSGAIGLGTIQGEVGQVKTKRQEPVSVPAEATGAPEPRAYGGHDVAGEEDEAHVEQRDAAFEKRSAGSKALVASGAVVAAGALTVIAVL